MKNKTTYIKQLSEEDRLKALEEERGKVYGKPRASHRNIGLSWTAIIQQYYGIELPHPIPDHVTAKMMVAFKNQRGLRVWHPDSGDDLRVYADFGDRFQQGKE